MTGRLRWEWAATAILRAVCRAVFATHSLQAFLNKKQGISAFHANLVQRLAPQRHLNDSLQFHLGNGGDRPRRSQQKFCNSIGEKFAFWDFYWISENFVFQFSWKVGELVFRGDSSLLKRRGINSNGIVSPRSKALSKIFENFEPQMPEKDGEMKEGTEG